MIVANRKRTDFEHFRDSLQAETCTRRRGAAVAGWRRSQRRIPRAVHACQCPDRKKKRLKARQKTGSFVRTKTEGDQEDEIDLN